MNMTILDVSVMTFDRPEAWQWLLQFCILATALLLGNLCRTQIPFLKKSLLPSALLGGLLLLVFKAIPGCKELINKPMMEVVTYHALGLGFVALALKNNKIESKSSPMKVIETGALTASSYVIQGIVGLLVSIPFFLFGKRLFYAAGLLLPMGYGQGPGQALNFGKIFTGWAEQQGLEFAGADFGLSIAAMGFIVGSVIGVVYMNILRRKGKLSAKKIRDAQVNKLEDYEGKNEIPDAESIDKLSVQISMVLFVYFLVYLFTNWIQGMELGKFGTNTLKPMLWGFNFLIGTLFGILFKNILNRFKKSRIIKREYINNYMLNRISGFCFDIMIVAGTAAINFEEFGKFVLPFSIICALGALATFVYVLWISKHLYPDYQYEGFFSMFGMLTGTASNGMILLREIDPKFETPAANNLVLQTLAAIVLGFPVLLLMGFAPQSLQSTWITLGILIVFWAGLTVFMLRKKIFKRFKN
jgi:ESS family glutamate:Na+ symporter